MTETAAIKTLIADDEPLARRAVRALLDAHTDFEVVGECSCGLGAAKAIEETLPDVVFLDIEMPAMGGFELIDTLAEHKPLVVFITAYDHYAVRAFDVSAVDYVLKPFDRKRLETTLQKVRDRVESERERNIGRKLFAYLEELKSPSRRFLDKVVVKSVGNNFFINTGDVDWIEAEGNYVRLHVGGKSHLVRENLRTFSEKLDPERFARIHRSTVVNIDRIANLQPMFHGDYRVILRDKTELTLSRSYRKNLKNF